MNKQDKIKFFVFGIISALLVVSIIISIIISAVNYSKPEDKKCGLVFKGYIKILNVVHFENEKGILILNIDVITENGNEFYISKYELITDISYYGILKNHYDNSSAINLYKNCNDRKDKKYYLDEIHYNSSGKWQIILAYSSFFLIVSLLIMFVLFVDYKIRKSEGIISPGDQNI